MNQQQRAGKHPSFLRDRKPYGMKKETFRKQINAPLANSSKERRHFDDKINPTAPVVTEKKPRSSFALEFHPDFYDIWWPLTFGRDTSGGFKPVSTVEILQTLQIEDFNKEILSALTSVRRNRSLSRKFADGQYKEVREHVLHLAAEEAMVNENHDLVSRILPQVHDRKLVMCMLSEGASALHLQHLLQAIQLVYKNHTRALELCLLEAVRHRRWSLAEKLMKVFEQGAENGLNGLEQGADTGKKGADKESPLIQTRRMCSKLLHLTLAKALEFRLWGMIDTCLKQGGNIVTACAETGYDLNTLSATTGKRILEDAIARGNWNLNTVRVLLQAGAKPDMRDVNGKTALHHAAESNRWSLVTLLLQFCSEVADFSSKPSTPRGTLLHIVCREGQVDILQTLLLKGADPLVTDGRSNTLMMAAMEARQGRENLIRVLIQSGMATHQALVSQSLLASVRERGEDPKHAFHSPMWTAVETGQLRIALMLYSSGACPAEEIQELATSLYIRERLETLKRTDVQDFLSKISSHPRSLVDACALKISHLIGCGPQRDVRAASLGLPNKLRGLVLQDHVVNPDFLKDCPPDTPADYCRSSFFRTSVSFLGRRLRQIRDFRNMFLGQHECVWIDFDNFYNIQSFLTRRLGFRRCSCDDFDK